MRVYYGWTVLVIAALAMVGTLPGRTQGLGLITEPLIADLGIDRVTYATVNFWATIVGAAGALGIGRLLDWLGSRVVLTLVAVGLGSVVCAMSLVTSTSGLAVSLTLTRAIGQSALSVISIAMVGHWFARRINTAMAVYSIALSIGFMIAFPVVGALVQRSGWRAAWFGIGVALVAGLAPLAWWGVRRSPEAMGVEPDGEPNRALVGESDGHRWTEAIGTAAFWVFAVGTALYGLIASGIGLFNESILAERGFGPDVYYRTLVITAMAGLMGNFAAGWLATRVAMTQLMAIALWILAGGLVALPLLASITAVMLWAAAMGAGGGIVMVLFFSVWPAVFGRRHLGRIQGVAQAMTVFASAIGPLMLAWAVELTGSYAAMFRALAAVVAATAMASLVVSLPAPAINEPERARG